jgi:hypothetical protein
MKSVLDKIEKWAKRLYVPAVFAVTTFVLAAKIQWADKSYPIVIEVLTCIAVIAMLWGIAKKIDVAVDAAGKDVT